MIDIAKYNKPKEADDKRAISNSSSGTNAK
ncbi:Uncharacterised protein [Segatella buccae]|jgi:hypothetical protein|uniref:Uncharacterized protein n=1 Tax=Segatella buccae TaxID=28126 RepID=A0AAQ1UJJ3_9BACT|nr:Uncharacterised protein [Segatella buccae]